MINICPEISYDVQGHVLVCVYGFLLGFPLYDIAFIAYVIEKP